MTRSLAILAAAAVFAFMFATLAQPPKRGSFEDRWAPVHQMIQNQWGVWSSGYRRSEAACSWVQHCRTV